ncbi:MAG TPA: hypothetical protein VFP21_01225 [Solirubrobacterales bacterium]|nr:hypothetical protein [Solirubrobacterales bacterium]
MADDAAPDPLAQLAAEEAAERQAAAAEEEAASPPSQDTPPQEAEPDFYAGRYRTREDVEAGIAEKDRFIGQLQNEMQQMRQQMQQIAQPQPQPQAQQYQDPTMATYGVTREQLEAAYETDPIGTMDWIAEQKAQARLAEYQQQMEPLYGQFNNVIAANAVEQLKQEVGPDILAEHADALREAIAADREYFGPPEIRLQRMKQAVYAAAYERERHQQSGRPRNERGQFAPREGDVHVEGGSGAQPQPQQPGPELTPEEQELAQLQTWRRPTDEKGIPLPMGGL